MGSQVFCFLRATAVHACIAGLASLTARVAGALDARFDSRGVMGAASFNGGIRIEARQCAGPLPRSATRRPAPYARSGFEV